ncbi:MAG: sigma-70 family RNA polymerase sigma factor [Planctomycetes bacterium]|nr:sigma-70 family RNA polymerase sigma factor [Planctomycetota bacterium]
MSKLSQAERYLLDQIRLGQSEAWSQFVERYRGRLLNFARAKLNQRADAEDIVQEVFISFIRALGDYRGDSSLETYLFSILRRKIIDTYRSGRAKHLCLIQDVCEGPADGESSDAFSNIAGREQTASWYVRRDEQEAIDQDALGSALAKLVGKYKNSLNFKDLQIVELLFYCQLTNSEVGRIMGVDSRHVGVIKHRCIKQVQQQIARGAAKGRAEGGEGLEDMLTAAWEQQRPSCPKRNTIGAYLLKTLDSGWQGFVDFHLNKMGCHFCRANLDDLRHQTKKSSEQKIQARIMESTIGFLHKL